MRNFSLFKKKFLRISAVNSEKGFSLVELLVAMVILVLIVFAFTPLFVGSIDRIYFAGDKTEALYQGQSDLEVDIAERITVDGLELVFTFGEDTEVTVPGRLVEAEVTEGRATAWLSGFVPIVPTINLYLAPLPLVEGYNVTPIVIMGNSTDFPRAKDQGEQFRFFNRAGTEVSGHSYTDWTFQNEPPADIPEGYDEYAEFDLRQGLTNSGSIYRLVLKWKIENNIEVVVRSRLQVVLPYAFAGGAGQKLWISPDAREIWKEKTQITGSGNFKDMIWTGFELIAVTTSGRIVTWRDSEDIAFTGESYGTLNGIAYGGGKYIVVGNGGNIYNSLNLTSWNSVSSSSSGDLQAAGYSGLGFMAVGSNGTILSSDDGSSWINESLADGGVTFKGITYGSQWLAVGNDSSGKAVIYSKSGETWNELELWEGQVLDESNAAVGSLPGLNDITYDGSRYIAVGDGGTLITSPDGLQWRKQKIIDRQTKEVIDLEPTTHLNAIDWGDITDDTNHYIIVGAEGTILTWTGPTSGEAWVLESSGITDTDTIYTVAVRWTN